MCHPAVVPQRKVCFSNIQNMRKYGQVAAKRSLGMTVNELEKRLCLLEDLDEIRKPQRHYVYCLDSQEYDKVVDCYAESGEATIRNYSTRRGKKEIADLYKTHGKKLGIDANFIGQPIISVDGDVPRGIGMYPCYFPTLFIGCKG